MEKAYSAAHAKFLFGQKGGGNIIVKKMLNQYKTKLEDRETSQKYFDFDKDGYMQSLPYDCQDFKYGINKKVFDVKNQDSQHPDPNERVEKKVAKTMNMTSQLSLTGSKSMSRIS